MAGRPNPLLDLEKIGQSVWIDYLSRELLESGKLRQLRDEDGIHGVTSNPTIFRKAISGSALYDESLRKAILGGVQDPRELLLGLEFEDIGAAADLMLQRYDASGGRDGYVSIEISPDLAYDPEASMREVRRLAKALSRKNVFVKVPATEAGPYAIERLIAEGFSINVTLLFSVYRYREVVEAYMRGLEQRVEREEPIDQIASVASFFVSRVDTLVDNRLSRLIADSPSDSEKERLTALLGKAAVANARLAYEEWEELFGSDRFRRLEAQGARRQRLLWASSSTKNKAYSDIKYVEELIAPETINTMTEATIEAFRDHGEARVSIKDEMDQVHDLWGKLAGLGIYAEQVGEQLEHEGADAFSSDYHMLLDEIASRRDVILKEAA